MSDEAIIGAALSLWEQAVACVTDEAVIRAALNAVYAADEGTCSYLLPEPQRQDALAALDRLTAELDRLTASTTSDAPVPGASGTAAKERELERRRDALVAEFGTVASLTKALQSERESVGRLEEADEAASVAHDYIYGLNDVTQEQASAAIWKIHNVLRPLSEPGSSAADSSVGDEQTRVGRLEEALRAAETELRFRASQIDDTPYTAVSLISLADEIAAALAGGTPPPGEQDEAEAGDAGSPRPSGGKA